MPVPQILEETVDVFQGIPQVSVSERTAEQFVDVPVVVQHQVSMFIDDMAQEAEKYRDENEADKVQIDVMSRFENYCVTVRNTLTEGKLAGRI